MTTSPSNETYPKDLDGALGLDYRAAVARARSGFLIARREWLGKGAYVFQAVAGSFIAFDKATGHLEPFLVAHLAGLNAAYIPSDEDREARDWVTLTRQQAQHGGDAA